MIRFEHCKEAEIERTLSFIKDYRGLLTNKQINLEGGLEKIYLTDTFKITHLNDFLKKHLKTDSSFTVEKSKFVMDRKNTFSLGRFNDVFVQCDQCSTMGKKTAKVTAINTKGEKNSYWVKFHITSRIKTLVPLSTINVNNQTLSARQFQWRFISTTNPEKYYTDLKAIKFHKANQVLKRNAPLLKRSLSPARLVKVGQPAIVRMNSGTLRLKSKALPTTSGKLGDTISLRNTRTKRTLIGKVIGKNLVEVEL